MVELIVVIILVGILSAIGVSRFFLRSGYDAAAFTEQARSMVRYAQKLAVAQNRNVYVQGDLSGVGLCFDAATPCPAASQVPAPSGENSGSAATRARCLANGRYAQGWYCEAWPDGVTMSLESGTMAPFYFDALGVPRADGTTFVGLTVSFSGGGGSSRLTVYQETGYVN